MNAKGGFGWKQAGVHFLKTTTLHGFKYLCSKFCLDRVGWLLCCCASTCCAALLCTVLWARFLEMPALLVLRGFRTNETVVDATPDLNICPPVETVAKILIGRLTNDTSKTGRLPRTVARALAGKTTADDQTQLLDQLLDANNITLIDAMYASMPPCEQLTLKCRWQNVMIPCNMMFAKEITTRGVCCVMRPKKSYYKLVRADEQRPHSGLALTRSLDLALQCSNNSIYSCGLLTKFNGEEVAETIALFPGYNYVAQLRFTSVPQSSSEEFIEPSCNSDVGYSRVLCLDKCAEKSCGCTDPLRPKDPEDDENTLPSCSVTQLGCLKASFQDNLTCNCLPSCNKVTTFTSLESNIMNTIEYAIDPIYQGLNASTATVLFLRVNMEHSRIFTLNPTETWFTLLSSLGGVFNMFLGVGLFSALEILFLVFIKLPIALKTTSEMPNNASSSKPSEEKSYAPLGKPNRY